MFEFILWNGFWVFLFFRFDEINLFSNFWICDTSISAFDFIGYFGDHSIAALFAIFDSFEIPTPPWELMFKIEFICSFEKSGLLILPFPYFWIISFWFPWFLITKNCWRRSSILLFLGEELKFFCFLLSDEVSENTSGECPFIILVLQIVSGMPPLEFFFKVFFLFWTFWLYIGNLCFLNVLSFY